MKEAADLDLKNVDQMISTAIEKIRTLKDEKTVLESRIRELEELVNAKSEEVTRLAAEKSSIKGQIEGLLSELESIES